MSTNLQSSLEQIVGALRRELGENLLSCCVYGSAVRGNSIDGVSDINLLLILDNSHAAAHAAVERAIGKRREVEPFVLGRRGFERSVRAFAPKFASIKRNYRVLHGSDLLASITLDAELERFLCEQSVRNLRLRLVHAFVTRSRQKNYDRFVISNASALFVRISEVLRLSGKAVDGGFEERIGMFEQELGIDGSVLRDLLSLKRKPVRFSEADESRWHERLFPLVDTLLKWIESHWQTTNL